MEDVLQAIESKVQTMPAISHVTTQLLPKLSDENFSVTEVARLIETDITLSTRCLHLVNSSYFGLREKVKSIRQAVTFLGRLNLISIVLIDSLRNSFSVTLKSYEEGEQGFWEHSLRTAIATKVIAWHLSSGINTDLAYTAGLLHDIGKVIIAEYIEMFSKEDLHRIKFNEMDYLLKQERTLLGTDHTQVGEKMAKKWKFPEIIVNVIRYHHEPGEAPPEYKRLVNLVHFGNLMSRIRSEEVEEFNSDDFNHTFQESSPQLDGKKIINWLKIIDQEYESIFEKLKSILSE